MKSQNLVQNKLILRLRVAYKSFRNYKQDFVAIWEDLYKKSKGIIYGSDRENANFLSTLISTKGSLVRGYLTKNYIENTTYLKMN